MVDSVSVRFKNARVEKMFSNIRMQWNAGIACVSERVLKTLACQGLRVGPSKVEAFLCPRVWPHTCPSTPVGCTSLRANDCFEVLALHQFHIPAEMRCPLNSGYVRSQQGTVSLQFGPPKRQKQGGPGSVRFGYGLGVEGFERFRFSVLAVPPRRGVFLCVSVQFNREGRFRFRFRFHVKRFWRFRFHFRFQEKRFRRFRFPVPVRFVSHPAKM